MTLPDSPILSPKERADKKREPTSWNGGYEEKPIPLGRKGKGKEKATVSAFERLPREIIQEYVWFLRTLARSCMECLTDEKQDSLRGSSEYFRFAHADQLEVASRFAKCFALHASAGAMWDHERAGSQRQGRR